MQLKNKSIKGVKVIKSKIFKDQRGFFREVYQDKILNKKFIFDVTSYSKKNVLRGLHIQTKKPQAKIVTVAYGKIMDVAVDLRKNSKTYGKYVSLIMSHSFGFSFYIPEGFAHGFLCLSKECIVYYKCSEYRDSFSEATLSWNDKSVGIQWPVKNPILSTKDKNGYDLSFFK